MSVQETYDDDEDLKDQVDGDEDDDDEEDDDDASTSETTDDADGSGDDEDGKELTSEERRARNRRDRQERKKRRKAAEEADKRRIQQLQQQLEDSDRRLQQLEGNVSSQDMARLDEAITRHGQGITQLRSAWSRAIEDGDGQKAADLEERIYRARSEKEHMERIKHARSTAPRRQPVQQVDPSVVTNAKGWMQTNSWYQPNSSDPDSRYVDAIDDQLAAEGWDPASSAYWDELSARVKQRLPNRFEASRRQGNRPRMMGGDRSSSSRSASGEGLRGVPQIAIDQWKEAGMTPKEINAAAAQYRKAHRS